MHRCRNRNFNSLKHSPDLNLTKTSKKTALQVCISYFVFHPRFYIPGLRGDTATNESSRCIDVKKRKFSTIRCSRQRVGTAVRESCWKKVAEVPQLLLLIWIRITWQFFYGSNDTKKVNNGLARILVRFVLNWFIKPFLTLRWSISGSSHNIILKPHLRCSISTFVTSYDHAS